MLMEGHDKPCYYCGKPCNTLAGNPSLWPVALCHRDDPGRVKWHHTGCVTDRLIENGGHERAAELQRLNVAMHNFIIKNDLFDAWEAAKESELAALSSYRR